MPFISASFQQKVGPLVTVGLARPGSFEARSEEGTDTGIAMFPTLIDIGASMTCISSRAASVAGLKPTGMRPMRSATHSLPVPTCVADVVLPLGGFGSFHPRLLLLESAAMPGSAFEILLGRDILCQGLLAMSPDGHFTFGI